MLELKDVSFSYDSVGLSWFRHPAHIRFGIKKINLAIPDGIRLGIIGASGSGKSTLLKLIGGHHFPDNGKILFDGEDISRREPGCRGVITVFQDHALFPHLTVYKNVEFPLNVEGLLERKDKEKLVAEYLERFSIWHLKDKKPKDLSGGERQRTAIARGLVTKPSVLLLDEPTASLDAEQKNELSLLLNESASWPKKPTVVLVTHDHEFALSLCEYIAIIDKGALIAHGVTRDTVFTPPNVRAAEILNNHGILSGKVDEELQFLADDGSIVFALPQKFSRWKNCSCTILIRSDVINIGHTSSTDHALLSGTVHAIQFHGVYTRLIVDVQRYHISCYVPRSSNRVEFSRKQKVQINFPINDIQIFETDVNFSGGDHGQKPRHI